MDTILHDLLAQTSSALADAMTVLVLAVVAWGIRKVVHVKIAAADLDRTLNLSRLTHRLADDIVLAVEDKFRKAPHGTVDKAAKAARALVLLATEYGLTLDEDQARDAIHAAYARMLSIGMVNVQKAAKTLETK